MQLPDTAGPNNAEDADLPEPPRCGLTELPPPDLSDPVLEIYKKDVDRTLLIKNLSVSPAERAEKLVDFTRFLGELCRAGKETRSKQS